MEGSPSDTAWATSAKESTGGDGGAPAPLENGAQRKYGSCQGKMGKQERPCIAVGITKLSSRALGEAASPSVHPSLASPHTKRSSESSLAAVQPGQKTGS